jgi:hypothetical protein
LAQSNGSAPHQWRTGRGERINAAGAGFAMAFAPPASAGAVPR